MSPRHGKHAVAATGTRQSGARRAPLLSFGFEEVFEFDHELADIFEVEADGGEADIGDLIEQERPRTCKAEPRYFDCVLRRVKEYNKRVDSMHQNLVRRGLVLHPEEWKWASVHEYGPQGSAPPFG